MSPLVGSIPTSLEQNKSPFAYEDRSSQQLDCERLRSLQRRKNGEGSLVRSRMAGCGPVDLSSNLSPCSFLSFSSLEKKKNLSSQKEETILIILRMLKNKPMTQKQIIEQLGLTDRAIRYILSKLLKDKIILQRASLLDARQKYYEVIK